MQSKGWIWQVCLLLTVSFIFSTALPQSSAFCQTETTPQEKTEPKSDDSEDNDSSPDEPDDETEPDDDGTDKEKDSSDDEDEDEKGDSKKKDDDDESEDDEPAESGSDDLSEAFALKIDARTTSDLDKIVRLCESALEKGLDENEAEQANYLASESLLRFAEGMAQRTFSTPQDRRWQFFRAQAMPRLKKAIKFNDSNVAAFILLAKFEAMDPQTKADALKNIEKAIELSVDDRTQLSDALVIRARLKEDKEEALADLNQAIKHNPDNIRAHELRAWALLSDKKVDEAIEDFEFWFKAQPENFSARVVVAQRLTGIGDLFDEDVQQKVLEILDEAAEIDPESGIPETIKATIFLEQENVDAAIKSATKAIDLDSRRPAAFRIRAAALAEKGDLDAAIKDANRLMKLDLMDGYELRSQLFIQKAEYAKAIEDLRAMSSADPNNEVLLQQLAALYNADLRPEESVKMYNRLLRNNLVPDEGDQPDAIRRVIMAKRADLLSSRGDARLSTGEHAKAISDYEESLGLVDELLAMFPKGKAKPPRDDGLLNNFAWMLSTTPEDDLRDGERAIKLATEAAENTNFEQAHILSTVAAAYAETGDFKTAIKWIKKGLKANKVAGAQSDAREEAIERQEKSLRAELEFYKDEKPWREKMDPDEEREKAKAKAKAKAKDSDDEDSDDEDSDDEDSDDEDSDDEDSDDDEDKDDEDKDDEDE